MKVALCRHIRPNGLQCQAIALKRGPFCYFHRRLHDTHRVYRNTMVARPDLERRGAIFDLGPLEDTLAIQIAISKTVNAIATNMIDLKHGRAILYGLHLAATNARRLNPTPEPTRVIRETQPDPTALLEETATPIAPEGVTVEVPTNNLPHGQIPVTAVISTEDGDSRRSGETSAFVPDSPNHHPPLTLCAAEQPDPPAMPSPTKSSGTKYSESNALPHRRPAPGRNRHRPERLGPQGLLHRRGRSPRRARPH